MLELGSVRQQVDRKHVEADGDAAADGLRELVQVSCGHAAEGLLLGGIDFGVGREEIAGGAGFDLEEDEGWAVPGDEVEVSAATAGVPAASDDGVSERTQMEESCIFATLAGKQVRRLGLVAGGGRPVGEEVVGAQAEAGVEAVFEAEEADRQGHLDQLLGKAKAVRNASASEVPLTTFQALKAFSASLIRVRARARSVEKLMS